MQKEKKKKKKKKKQTEREPKGKVENRGPDTNVRRNSVGDENSTLLCILVLIVGSVQLDSCILA